MPTKSSAKSYKLLGISVSLLKNSTNSGLKMFYKSVKNSKYKNQIVHVLPKCIFLLWMHAISLRDTRAFVELTINTRLGIMS